MRALEYIPEQNLLRPATHGLTKCAIVGCAALKPTCIICPRNPKEVVSILDILHQNNETFAIKSGGHNPNKYFASVQGGPLISLEEVKEIEYQPETETVRVGSGARWQDVILELETVERVVVGGRMGHVGVGGYLLGGEKPVKV